ncbi:phosphoglycerol transferase [Paenibacillus baekrokdamisoli]|uniref:Phosphoglycerol transferase n=1 Tax=Paenibacillus baekrokdamisoli TaxID=1712516 RepID=A0A3G9J2G6_9BACL|nr:LTA synthase family protein [Paenibacillus baekrokdamisoli]MBB3070671.1 phosphoglycerol transferase MdoB-like AlkP superfamily enzyme [Paenibacillus baekrokdamisoli]BBH20021.1 phosphoglycerol transferase [Paenibacillus baekrokdamisoli]
MRNVPYKRIGWTLAGLLIVGLALNLFLQAASLNMNGESALAWMTEHIWIYLVGGLFFFFVLLAVVSVVGNVYMGTLIVVVVGALVGTADYKKLNATGEPLFPWDMMLLRNAKEMGQITKGMISPFYILVALVIIAAVVYLTFKMPKVRIPLVIRAGYVVVSIAAVIGFVQLMGGNHSKLFRAINYQNLFWTQKANYTENGFLFAFAANLKQDLIDEPEGYSESAVTAIARKYSQASNSASSVALAEQPNIMFMMDEAFFDSTRLPTFSFSEDPLSFIHSEEKSTPSGYMLSPEFGGNTANIEFEALTGESMYFLKDGSIPYQEKIVKESSLPSIVSILKARGYQALALHPFDETFYNRNRVYPILGFDRFTSQADLQNAQRITPNGYISDMAAVKEAIQELQSAEKPTFLHLVTMQNHFPFTKGLNGPNTVKVNGVKPERKDELETYVQDTKLTDQALAYLHHAIQSLKRPTIVVFWGDHLPALSADIYTQAGWDVLPKQKHETPLLFMANFDIGKQPIGTLSPAFIGPTVFELTGQQLPPYYKLLVKVKNEIPGLSKNVLTSSDAVLQNLTAEQKSLLDDYRMIEYDLLAGNRYSEPILFPKSMGS